MTMQNKIVRLLVLLCTAQLLIGCGGKASTRDNHSFTRNPEEYISMYECRGNGECKEIFTPGARKSYFIVDRGSTIRVEFNKWKMRDKRITGNIKVRAKVLSPTVSLLPVTNYVREEGEHELNKVSFEVSSARSRVYDQFKTWDEHYRAIQGALQKSRIILYDQDDRDLTKEDVDEINRKYAEAYIEPQEILPWDASKKEPDVGKLNSLSEEQKTNLITVLVQDIDTKGLRKKQNELTIALDKYFILLNNLLVREYGADTEQGPEVERLIQIRKSLKSVLPSIRNADLRINMEGDFRSIKDSYNVFQKSLSGFIQDLEDLDALIKEVQWITELSQADYLEHLEDIPPAEIDLFAASLDKGGVAQVIVENSRLKQKPQQAGDSQSEKAVENNTFNSFENKYTFKVIDLGFAWSVTPAVSFIKRLHRPNDSDPKDGTVASNYKPSPGANLILRYNTDNETVNFFTPSLVMNVSLVDFNNETIEVGGGFGLGWLNDMVAAGYGWNLNETGKDRDFYFLTINFIESIDTFKPIFNPAEQ